MIEIRQIPVLFLCGNLQRIDEDTDNNNDIADQFSSGDFFLQNHSGKQKYEDICGCIDDRAVTHIYFCVAPGIQKQNTEEKHIGKYNAPVEVFFQRILIADICALFQKNLGDSRKKGSSQHNQDKCSIHIFAPSILQIIRSEFQ